MEAKMNAFEQKIKTTLIADRKFVLENLDLLKNPENYGTLVCEPPEYFYNRLKQIDEQWERLENGEYNTCRSCAGPIGNERLSSNPCAVLCITCQNKVKLGYAFRLIHKFINVPCPI
jgi:hypothetical protein